MFLFLFKVKLQPFCTLICLINVKKQDLSCQNVLCHLLSRSSSGRQWTTPKKHPPKNLTVWQVGQSWSYLARQSFPVTFVKLVRLYIKWHLTQCKRYMLHIRTTNHRWAEFHFDSALWGWGSSYTVTINGKQKKEIHPKGSIKKVKICETSHIYKIIIIIKIKNIYICCSVGSTLNKYCNFPLPPETYHLIPNYLSVAAHYQVSQLSTQEGRRLICKKKKIIKTNTTAAHQSRLKWIGHWIDNIYCLLKKKEREITQKKSSKFALFICGLSFFKKLLPSAACILLRVAAPSPLGLSP